MSNSDWWLVLLMRAYIAVDIQVGVYVVVDDTFEVYDVIDIVVGCSVQHVMPFLETAVLYGPGEEDRNR